MTRMTSPPDIGAPISRKGQFVMTERAAHEAWARLIARKPRAAQLAHHLVASMGHQNAVVVSQAVLAKMMGCSVETVKRAVRDLVAERWVSVVRIGKGKESAYIVNDRVAWGQPRDQLRLPVFSATVIADFDDQEDGLLGSGEMRKIPTLFVGETQLPSGPGEEPPSQPSISGLEPDLPALNQTQAELEKRGQRRLIETEEPRLLTLSEAHARLDSTTGPLHIEGKNFEVWRDENGETGETVWS
mgnify:FL=1